MLPSLRLYFGHPTVIPSFSLSLLYLTVLLFSGQMLIYLLASNINLWQSALPAASRQGSSLALPGSLPA